MLQDNLLAQLTAPRLNKRTQWLICTASVELATVSGIHAAMTDHRACLLVFKAAMRDDFPIEVSTPREFGEMVSDLKDVYQWIRTGLFTSIWLPTRIGANEQRALSVSAGTIRP